LDVTESHFKGWAKPGPVPPGALAPPEVPPDETLDAISGHFRIFQLRDGHRFSTDDVLTAWYGTSWAPTASRVLDLGSGIGSVGMIAAWRLAGARVVTIEAQEESVRLARKSAIYNGLTRELACVDADGNVGSQSNRPDSGAGPAPKASTQASATVKSRYEIRHADFRDDGALAPDEIFDLVLGSPPYFPLGSGIEGDHPQKVACRFELRGDITDYARVAARHLAPGGVFACVFPEDQRARLESAARTADTVIVRRRPVVFREGEPPLVGLFLMMRAADLPASARGRSWVEPPLIVRASDGSVHPEYAAVKLAIGFPP
jgi:tRNA1(Val) A37 N6-methylase TrmN6